MSNILTGLLPRDINKDKARDTGLAMVLILLLLELFIQNNLYYKIAIAALVIDMVVPLFYKPVAYLWFGLANIIGTVVSIILLFVIYSIIVIPVALLRKMMGKDPMRLKEWKQDSKSVLRERNYLFTTKDIEKPF